MDRSELLELFMDSLKHHFVFVDTEHVIRYMNKPAVERYKGKPAKVGMSIFACHKEESQQIILNVVEAFKEGEDEKMIFNSEDHRTFMRAVRDRDGNLIGYYERFEPPDGYSVSDKKGATEWGEKLLGK
jgi:DUF438 domain-containing protein